MTFDEVKKAVVSLDDDGRKRLVCEALPAIWSTIVKDEVCLDFLRKIVDEEAVRKYKEEHMDSI